MSPVRRMRWGQYFNQVLLGGKRFINTFFQQYKRHRYLQVFNNPRHTPQPTHLG